MPKIHINARTNWNGSHYWTVDRIQQHHEAQLNLHLPLNGFESQISWVQEVAAIAAEYQADRSGGDGPALAAADTALQVVQQVGLGIIEATITDSVRAWAATGPIGALGGLGLTKDAGPGMQFAGMIFGGLFFGLIGLFIKVEVPIYRLTTSEYGQWVWMPVPPGSAAPVGLTLALS